MNLAFYLLLALSPTQLPLALEEQSVVDLIEALRSESVEKRNEAENLLIAAGLEASSQVRTLLRSSDPELQARARRIVRFHRWGLTVQDKRKIETLIEESYVAPQGKNDSGTYQFFFVKTETWEAWKALKQKPARFLLSSPQ